MNELNIHLDEQKRDDCVILVLEPLPVRSGSVVSDIRMVEFPREQIPASRIDNGEIMHLKPSQLPLMTQVNIEKIRRRKIYHKFLLDGIHSFM